MWTLLHGIRKEIGSATAWAIRPKTWKAEAQIRGRDAEWKRLAFIRHDPPYQGEDNLAGRPSTNPRYLETQQAVSLQFRQESGRWIGEDTKGGLT